MGTQLWQIQVNSFFSQSIREIFFVAYFLSGGLAVAIPGELYSYHEAHVRYGKLEWEELFAGAIEKAQKGFAVGKHLALAIREKTDEIMGTELK